MDPNSAYYQQLQDQMTQQLGQQGEAQQRASALRAAYSGFGAGAGAEQLATAGDIGQANLQAQGQAAAGLRMMAPQMGAQALQSTFQPGLGLERLGEQSRQFGAGLAAQQNQFGANLGLQQQTRPDGYEVWRVLAMARLTSTAYSRPGQAGATQSPFAIGPVGTGGIDFGGLLGRQMALRDQMAQLQMERMRQG
jgi:hypothetical protein